MVPVPPYSRLGPRPGDDELNGGVAGTVVGFSGRRNSEGATDGDATDGDALMVVLEVSELAGEVECWLEVLMLEVVVFF